MPDGSKRTHHYGDTNWIVICAIILDVLPEFLEEIREL